MFFIACYTYTNMCMHTLTPLLKFRQKVLELILTCTCTYIQTIRTISKVVYERAKDNINGESTRINNKEGVK